MVDIVADHNSDGVGMVISCDYDHCFTLDPEYFTAIINAALQRGHRVIICTYRLLSDPMPHQFSGIEVFYTERKAKKAFLESRGIKVDVWFDDRPEVILYDGL
jgi:hypothetical protein